MIRCYDGCQTLKRNVSLSGGRMAFRFAFLESLGFMPASEGAGRTVPHNCPFHPIAVQAPHLVCGVNHAFLCGYLAAGEVREAAAVLTPRAGVCCVELRTGRAPGGDGAQAADSACARDAPA